MKLKSNDQEGHLKLEPVSYLCRLSVNMQWMLQFLWPQLLLLLEHWHHVKSLLPLCSSHTANLHEASLFFPENFHKFPKSLYITNQNILLLQMKPTYICQHNYPFALEELKSNDIPQPYYQVINRLGQLKTQGGGGKMNIKIRYKIFM